MTLTTKRVGSISSRAVGVIGLAGLAFAVVGVYGSSLSYPFFWVDPIDIGLAASRSVGQIFTTSEGYLYYRPFTFILWKILYALSGRFDPFAFHLVQVAGHLVNSALVYLLARRLFERRLPAGIAAVLFAWYPASHQAVTWIISPQVQATTLLLGSAIAYYDGRTQASRGKIWLSLALVAIALPFHENAMSFGFVIAALEGYLCTTVLRRARLSRWPLAHLGVGLAFAALWLAIPKDPESAVTRFDPAVGWYLLQGLIWPVAGAVGPWRAWLAGPAWQPLILVAPLTLAFLFIAHWRGRKLSLLAFGLIWFAVMVLPIWATRGIGYVGVSPRVFYVAAPGAILIWAALLSIDLKARLINRVWKIGLAVLIVSIGIQSAQFLTVRKTLHDSAMPAVWDIVHSGQQAGDQANLLYVNAPDQITPYRREYPVGFFRAVLLPVSVDLGQYVELQTGVRPQTRSITAPPLARLEDFPYQVDMRGEAVDQTQLSEAIRAADAVYIAEYHPDGSVRMIEAGRVIDCSGPSNCAPNDLSLAIFGDDIRLLAADIALVEDRTRMRVTWECLQPLSAEDTIFVHVSDASGQPAVQADGDPLHGLFPLSACQPGEQITDVRFVTPPAGTHTIRVGIYNRASGERLPAIDANGQRLPDDAAPIGTVTR